MIAPKLPSFFKSHYPKQFELKPRYYDPDAEEKKMRIDRIKRELGNDHHSFDADGFRQQLRDRWERSTNVRQNNASSTLRLIIIVAALAMASFYILQ